MLNVRRLGVILRPKDNMHAKFNAGMIKEGDKVHFTPSQSPKGAVATQLQMGHQ